MFRFEKGWVNSNPMTWGLHKTHCASTVTLCVTLSTPITHTPWLLFSPDMTLNSLWILDHPILSSIQHLSKPGTSQLMAYHYSARYNWWTSNSIICRPWTCTLFPYRGVPETDIVCHSIGPELHNGTRIPLAQPLHPQLTGHWAASLPSNRRNTNPWAHPLSRRFHLCAPIETSNPVSEIWNPPSLVEPEKHQELPSSMLLRILTLASLRAPNVFNFGSHTLRSWSNYDLL